MSTPSNPDSDDWWDPESPPSVPPSLPSTAAEEAGAWTSGDSTLFLDTIARPRNPAELRAETPGPDGQIPTIGHIGRYALKYHLGEGGIGTVYAAQDPLLSRLIAVKTLHVEVAESEREAFNALFLNEARAAAGLSHPHIVTVFDAGISDDRAYIAMELLKGRDLRQLRVDGWRASPSASALIVRRVADALAYAHSKGVVHRDVKPANIFMTGGTQPKVLDFGIARIAHQHDVGSDPGDIAAGSPYYMAPEQARQEMVDRRADVFSLGVVLYELLTNTKPFRGNTLLEITNAVLMHEPPLADQVAPEVPHALALITARALEKDPEKRYRSARAFARELRHWLDENEIGSEGELPDQATPHRMLWATVGVSTVLIAGALWLALSPKTRSAPEPVAAASAPTLVSAPPAPASAVVASVAASVAAPVVASVAASAIVPAASAAPTVDTASLPAEARPATPATALPAEASPLHVDPWPTAKVAKDLPKFPPKESTKETTKERRAREARERATAAPAPAAPLPTGMLRIAVSPWGEVEIDGKAMGTSPPLTEITLPQGTHKIVIRNSEMPAFSTQANVTAGQTVSIKHKF